MKELKTVQQKEKLNDVLALGEKGNGGAYHKYAVVPHGVEGDIPVLGDIRFQNGARKEEGSISGVLDSDLLEIVKHRLECFQEGPFSSEYNERALHHVKEALFWMNRRVEDRIARNVLGTNNK